MAGLPGKMAMLTMEPMPKYAQEKVAAQLAHPEGSALQFAGRPAVPAALAVLDQADLELRQCVDYLQRYPTTHVIDGKVTYRTSARDCQPAHVTKVVGILSQPYPELTALAQHRAALCAVRAETLGSNLPWIFGQWRIEQRCQECLDQVQSEAAQRQLQLVFDPALMAIADRYSRCVVDLECQPNKRKSLARCRDHLSQALAQYNKTTQN